MALMAAKFTVECCKFILKIIYAYVCIYLYYWYLLIELLLYIYIYSSITSYCMVTCFTGPSALTVNITKDIESLSLVVQWDAVEDFIDTIYTLVWSSESNSIPKVVHLTEPTSYTITGLTLDTVYTIAISAGNMCGQGPEYTTSILFAAGNTSTISSISPTVAMTTTTSTTDVATTITDVVSSIPTTDFDNPAGSTCKFLKHMTTQGYAELK